MPRRARVLLPGVTLHLIQRGNNRLACFFAEEDYLFYSQNYGLTCEEDIVIDGFCFSCLGLYVYQC